MSLEKLSHEIKALNLPAEAAKRLPPPCFLDMEGSWISYEHRKSLTVSFPVMEKQTNPLGTMQGGYIAAAFDNTFGPLSMVAARAGTTTIDLNINYCRSIKTGEKLIVTATVVIRGFSTLQMSAEAVNESGKLISTATTNMLIIKMDKRKQNQ